MKILIADCKMFKKHDYSLDKNKPLFCKKTKQLFKELEALTIDDIHDLMHVSFKQANIIYNYYHQSSDLMPAFNILDGIVYKQLEVDKYSSLEYKYLEDYLCINSPLYGLLRYNDAIIPHRLEISHRIKNINLYDYWRDDIDKYFKKEDIIISLTTKEYLKMIHHSNVINIDFGDLIDNKIRRSAIYLKQARGKMLNYMIINHITSIEEIKKITFDGYQYQDDLSNDHNLVFLRKPEMKYKKL